MAVHSDPEFLRQADRPPGAVRTQDVKPDVPRGLRPLLPLKSVRQWHLWLGTFFAPTVLFFAFTGGLQTFSLHETRPGSNYRPPHWAEVLAQIHKNQTPILPPKRPPGPPRNRGAQQRPATPAPAPEAAPRRSPAVTLALKWFVLLMAAGLMFTTCLGIYMAFLYGRDRRITIGLLACGAILPAALIVL